MKAKKRTAKAAKKQQQFSVHKRSTLRLPDDTHIWWSKQVRRIASKECLTQFSLTALMRRIAIANLDLSQKGLERYRRNLRPTRKTRSPG